MSGVEGLLMSLVEDCFERAGDDFKGATLDDLLNCIFEDFGVRLSSSILLLKIMERCLLQL